MPSRPLTRKRSSSLAACPIRLKSKEAGCRCGRLFGRAWCCSSRDCAFDQLYARTFAGTSERPLASYLEQPPSYVVDGLLAAERAFGYVTADARKNGAKVAFVLMPARFQLRDEEYQGHCGKRREEAPAPRAPTSALPEHLASSTSPCWICFRYSRLSGSQSLYFVGNFISPRAARVVAEALLDFMIRNRLIVMPARR